MKKILHIILISLFCLTIVTCAKKDDSDSSCTLCSVSTAKITGKISGSGASSRSSFATSSANTPDKILAMYNHGKSNKEFTIQSDGSFEVDTSLLNRDDLVIFVVNSNSKTILGHLNLEATNEENLELLDSSKMESDLSLGDIDCADNCSSTETLSTTTSFKSSELDNLQNISRSDDAVALFSNNWKNPTIESYVSTVFNIGSISNMGENYTDVDNFSKTNSFSGMHPLFYANLDNISGLYLYPPSPIKHAGGTRIHTSINDNLTDSADNSTPIIINCCFSNYSTSGRVSTISAPYTGSFPSGDWRLTYTDNTTFGNFQFVGGEPFDNASKFKVFIPSLKVNTDSSGKWLSINLKFYKQSSSGVNESVNYGFFKTLVHSEFCSYGMNGLGYTKNMTLSNVSATDTVWELTPKTDEQFSDVNRIICNYMVGQAKYSFYFTN